LAPGWVIVLAALAHTSTADVAETEMRQGGWTVGLAVTDSPPGPAYLRISRLITNVSATAIATTSGTMMPHLLPLVSQSQLRPVLTVCHEQVV
jgi:hypothetical protein